MLLARYDIRLILIYSGGLSRMLMFHKTEDVKSKLEQPKIRPFNSFCSPNVLVTLFSANSILSVTTIEFFDFVPRCSYTRAEVKY